MHRFLLFFLLAGCSGYRFSQQENPLSQYGIQSLAVPMFYNYGNLSDVSPSFTRETYRLLTGFSGLKLINGYEKNADAILIGIIKTPEKLTESLRPSNLRVAPLPTNPTGKTRGKFYVPGSSSMQLYLQVIVIKKPTEEELALLKSGIGDQVMTNSRVIFNELIPLQRQFTREILADNGGEVNATQNLGIQRKNIQAMAEQAATSIRDMILYAF